MQDFIFQNRHKICLFQYNFGSLDEVYLLFKRQSFLSIRSCDKSIIEHDIVQFGLNQLIILPSIKQFHNLWEMPAIQNHVMFVQYLISTWSVILNYQHSTLFLKYITTIWKYKIFFSVVTIRMNKQIYKFWGSGFSFCDWFWCKVICVEKESTYSQGQHNCAYQPLDKCEMTILSIHLPNKCKKNHWHYQIFTIT